MFGTIAQHDPGVLHLGEQFVPDALLVGDQSTATNRDLGQLLGRRAAVRGGPGDARPRLTDQAGDSNGIELIEVGRADRQEPQPFKQRVPRVLGLLQDAVVEIQPG
jgi:hypothetical protein